MVTLHDEDRHHGNDPPQNGGRLGIVPAGSIRAWGERLVVKQLLHYHDRLPRRRFKQRSA